MKNQLHFSIFDKKRIEIFKIISKNFNRTNYLAGGTALALQIRHRESFDFDLFQNKNISFQMKGKIKNVFKDFSIKTLVDTGDEFSFALDNEIKITFLYYYWPPVFPLIKKTVFIPILSIREIALTKAFTIGKRGMYRDYFDLYVIIKKGYYTLKKIIEGCKKKYNEVFSERMFLEQLSYTDDIIKENAIKFLDEEEVAIKDINKFFKKEIKKL